MAYVLTLCGGSSIERSGLDGFGLSCSAVLTATRLFLPWAVVLKVIDVIALLVALLRASGGRLLVTTFLSKVSPRGLVQLVLPSLCPSGVRTLIQIHPHCACARVDFATLSVMMYP